MPATEATKRGIVDPEDQHRSSMYALLSSLLCSPPTIDLLEKVNSLSGGENKIGEAIKTLTMGKLQEKICKNLKINQKIKKKNFLRKIMN